MRVKTVWPWITMLLSAVLALNPLGLDILSSAFFSGEALSRNIWRPIVLMATTFLAALGALEWFVRRLILNRRARGTTTA
ncbi:hypothetical protein V1281_002067 [Nitrobacteraceae bacterium AZCC 2161]